MAQTTVIYQNFICITKIHAEIIAIHFVDELKTVNKNASNCMIQVMMLYYSTILYITVHKCILKHYKLQNLVFECRKFTSRN